MAKDPVDRFLNLCMPEPNSGCWLWLGTLRSRDYGSFHYEGSEHLAHRISYLLFKGDLGPWGNVIDHKCGNKLCVNPDHLEQVSYKENTQRWWRSKRKVRDITHAQGLEMLTICWNGVLGFGT